MRKFNLGDMVWKMKNNTPVEWEIWCICETLTQVSGAFPKRTTRYLNHLHDAVTEDEVFATKQELLDSL